MARASKVHRYFWVLSLVGGGVAMAMASSPAAAQADACSDTVRHRLMEFGLTMDDLEDVEWAAHSSGRHMDGGVIGYSMWSKPAGCESGNLVFDLTGTCSVATVYTRAAAAFRALLPTDRAPGPPLTGEPPVP